MKHKYFALFIAFLAFSTRAFAQGAIRLGTVLPVRLNSSLYLKTPLGKVITASVMQDIVLPTGATIRAGAKVVGHVTAVRPAANGARAQIVFAFDRVVAPKQTFPVTTNLRAMASFVEIEAAQVPRSGPDRGTPENAWTTVMVGGDIEYRGGGPVTEGSKIVGRPVFDGVIGHVSAKPGTDCRGAMDGNDMPQALWVFSSDACGFYGFPGLEIAQAGRSDPIGEIVLKSNGAKMRIQSGSGILLRVISSGEKTAKTRG